METLTIGQVAKEANVGLETIRFYEREGLIPAPARTESGYREYRSEDVQRVRFIHEAQKIGFTLDDIRELLSLQRASTAEECERVKARIQKRIDVIDGKIAELQSFRDRLGDSLNRCTATGDEECPVVLDLSIAARAEDSGTA